MFDDLEEEGMKEGVEAGEGGEDKQRKDEERQVGGRSGTGGAERLVEYLEERIGRALARKDVDGEVEGEVEVKQEEKEDRMFDWLG